ncbi:MAG: AAA family ATPase [Pseudohongiella sp.]|nr:AAA family ATPase [Pseudohongiella sp.]
MRILGIRFKNINSLAGEWQVDFTSPEFTGDGIFAITGPTGAGKTTLLDVICLALYGRTPRLERVNKSANDVMTRQTGECFAEVTFSTPAGKFRCHWSQHKARKKADGELQTPKHEISNADSGQVIDNQIRTVAQRIEQTTGMDFERFTQSMMLAQGGFAAFLKATADERAPILEQITGTSIYSDISIKVHERHALERNLLQTLQTELSGLQLLTPEQEVALQTEEAIKSAELTEQTSLLHTLRQQRDWKQLCLQLEQKLDLQNKQREHWVLQNQAFAAQREKLEKANRALALSGQHSALNALRQNQLEDEQRLKRITNAEPDLRHILATQRQNLEQAAASRQQAEGELTSMRPVFRQVHVLDSQLHQQRALLSQADTEYAALLDEQEKAQQQNDRMRIALEQQKTSLNRSLQAGEHSYEAMLLRLSGHCETTQQWVLEKHADINTLTQGKPLSHWLQRSEQLSQALTRCDALSRVLEEYNLLKIKLQTRELQIRDIDLEIKKLGAEQQQSRDLLAAREISFEALQQQKTLLHTIKNLESHRAALSAGQPCPLCGATDHPYASHAPDADVEALTNNIVTAEKLLIQNRDQLQNIVNNLLQQQERCSHFQNQFQEEKTSCAALEQKIASQRHELKLASDITLDQHRDALKRELAGINQTLDVIEYEQDQLRLLELAAEQARDKLNEVRLLISSLTHAQELLESSELQLQKLTGQTNTARANRAAQQQRLDSLSTERRQLVGDQDPDTLESELLKALASADAVVQTAIQQKQVAEKQLHDNIQQGESLTLQLSERKQKILAEETAFNSLLTQKGFNQETEYLAASLPETQRLHLQQQADQLRQQGTELNALIRQSTSELDVLQQQALSPQSLETLQQALQEQETKTNLLQETLGGLRRDLRSNEQTREKQKYQAEKIDSQKRELERWSTLHELIGSGDGKKFRNFAQGLTFELMISHANQQLKKMSDRYLLLRDPDQPLDLNVVDFYQAGEIRSTKNLSGGESFIVSLALALGLSRMASRNVRVDSLFLDEGFGTLDEDALDTALETLAGLQQEGKLIGVISHVPALKERISTQIKVMPGPGGRSTLSGPGCQAL